MSQGFNLRFDKMRENNPASPDASKAEIPLIKKYDAAGYPRNVCFVWPDGSFIFSQYVHLHPGKFDPNGEMNKIVLDFSSHVVTLTGYRLESLAMEFLDHLPRIVTAVDPRYGSTQNGGPIVTAINVEYKGG